MTIRSERLNEFPTDCRLDVELHALHERGACLLSGVGELRSGGVRETEPAFQSE
jgi:hypothetical protein